MNKRRSQIFVLALLVLVISYGVWATQVAVTIIKGPYPGTVSSGDLDIAMTAVTAGVSEVTFTITGKEILLVYNRVDGDPALISLTSVANEYGRKGDISSYSISPSEMMGFKFNSTVGWATSDHIVHATASTEDCRFALIRY